MLPSERAALLNAVTDDFAPTGAAAAGGGGGGGGNSAGAHGGVGGADEHREARQWLAGGGESAAEDTALLLGPPHGDDGGAAGGGTASSLRKSGGPGGAGGNDGGADYDGPVYWEVFVCVMFVFSGYGCLFALQHFVKEHLGIPDNESTLSHLYGLAASLVYVGNLVFRVGHNFLFYFLTPRTRVVVATCSMALSMTTIVIVMATPVSGHSLPLVFVAYFLGGLGIGTFESNVLSSIAPLGHTTKLVAIAAIPVGITLITIGAFLLDLAGVHPIFVFGGVGAGCLLSVVCWMARIYRAAGSDNFVTPSAIVKQFVAWRKWIPTVWQHSAALLLDMFCVSLFTGVLLYVYDEKGSVPMAWLTHLAKKPVSMDKNAMFAVYNGFFFLGDFSSRRIWFPRPIISPFIFWIFSLLGAAAGLAGHAELIFFCSFFIAFANGSIYAQANKKIDQELSAEYSIIAFSFWLFIGDIGSVAGSNVISFVAPPIQRYSTI